MRIAYVTTAQQGAGHFTRGVAIGRGLRRAGFTGEFRLFSPPIPYAVGDEFVYTALQINAGDALDPQRAPTSGLGRALRDFAPDLVLVDLYWYAVQNALAGLDCECWLLMRCCPRNWFEPRRLTTPEGEHTTRFDRSRYTRIVAIEALWFDFFTDLCSPIVVANPDECRPTFALRRRLEVPSGRRLVMVTHAGLEGELDALHVDALEGDVVSRFSLFDPEVLYPAAEWLLGADVIYSGAGYNSYWEARWLGYHDRTRFTAFPRSYDWQQWRLKCCRDLPMKQNGADQLAAWMLGRNVNLLTRVVRRLRGVLGTSAPSPAMLARGEAPGGVVIRATEGEPHDRPGTRE